MYGQIFEFSGACPVQKLSQQSAENRAQRGPAQCKITAYMSSNRKALSRTINLGPPLPTTRPC